MRNSNYMATNTSQNTKNIDPGVWGPPLWDMLFCFAYKLPPHIASDALHNIAKLLEKVLPCQHCRRSYILHAKQYKFNTDNPAQWLWTIHDMVNQNLGKNCITYDKVQDKHQLFTCMTHPLNVVDLLCIMASVIKHDGVVEFANAITDAARNCPGLAMLEECLPKLSQRSDLFTELWRAHSKLAIYSKIAPLDYGTFWKKYHQKIV